MPILYPLINDNGATRDFQEQFLGYNHNIRIADGEFYDMQNMTGDNYPVLSTRQKRGINYKFNKPQGMVCKDALCFVDNGHLYINGAECEAFNGLSISDNRYSKKMIGMGAYLLVFNETDKGLQDGWYINTVDTSEHGFIDNVNNINCTENIPLQLIPCMKEGIEYQTNDPTEDNYVFISDTAPTTKQIKNGYKWLDTSGDTHYLKVWNEGTSMWVSVLTTFVKLSAPNIAEGFSNGDAVTISGLHANDANVSEQVNFLNQTAIIQSIDKDNNAWIVISGIIDKSVTQDIGTVKIARQAPYMDFICERNNRLWGCRYGLNRNNKVVNEIYSCKQGDFKNWFCYAGISTDSYSASVGSDGVFTGCVHYGDNVLFFKENCIHKLYGNIPADFSLIEQKVRGLQKGSEKSLCTVNETLFYKSATDICYYDGSLPVSISNQLGDVTFTNAVAGSINNKYYVCMTDNNGLRTMFVFDIAKQMWHKEDSLNILEFCRVDSRLFFIDSDTNYLMCVNGGDQKEDNFNWFVESGVIGYEYSDNKYVGRIVLRLCKPLETTVKVFINYDDTIDWECVADLSGLGTRSFSFPITPRRCDHYRIRISGNGECKIYSISKVLEIGSDG